VAKAELAKNNLLDSEGSREVAICFHLNFNQGL